MSSSPEQALAAVKSVPASLRILRKPFGLDTLRASLEAVDEWLCKAPQLYLGSM